jgi:hypothetical protein
MAPKQAAPKKKRASGARTTQQQKERNEKRRAEKETRLRNAGETTCQDKPRQTAKKKKKASGTRNTQEQREAWFTCRNMARRADKEMRKTMDEATVIPQEVFFERRHETMQKRPKEGMRLWLPHTLKTLGFCTVYSDVCASLAEQIRLGEQIGQMKRRHKATEAMHTSTPQCYCGCNKEGCFLV